MQHEVRQVLVQLHRLGREKFGRDVDRYIGRDPPRLAQQMRPWRKSLRRSDDCRIVGDDLLAIAGAFASRIEVSVRGR